MYIALDCEMGGIDLKYSLLTAYFVILTDDLQPRSELYLRLKPDDGDYIVCGEALGVNKINLAEHDKVAVPYHEGRSQIGKWLRDTLGAPGRDKLRAIGHNVNGDIRFVWQYLYARQKWETYVSYRQLDTATICQFLKDNGKLPKAVDGPEGVSGSLMSLVRYLGIPYKEEELHDAKVDTLLTVEVYKRLLTL
jgi:hypothetical protein